MDTRPHPNGYTSKNSRFTGIGILLLIIVALTADAQKEYAYKAVLKITGGGPPLIGFLYAVNDTAVVILPTSQVTPRGLKAALEISKPISIPSNLIEKVSIAKVRTLGHIATTAVLLTFGYITAFALIVPVNDPVAAVGGILLSGILANITGRLIYWRTHRPSDPGFMIRMQEYCLNQNGLMVDR